MNVNEKSKRMRNFTPNQQSAILTILGIASLFLLASCRATREMAKESLVESIVDSRTGTQFFTREYDTEQYSLNAAGIIKCKEGCQKEKSQGNTEELLKTQESRQ